MCTWMTVRERNGVSFFTNKGKDMFVEERKFWHKIIIKFSANSREANGGSSCGEGPAEGLVQPVQKK